MDKTIFKVMHRERENKSKWKQNLEVFSLSQFLQTKKGQSSDKKLELGKYISSPKTELCLTFFFFKFSHTGIDRIFQISFKI